MDIIGVMALHTSLGGNGGDTLPPSPVTNITSSNIKNDRITLSWTNPTDRDFDHVVVVRNTTSFPTSVTDGTEVYSSYGRTFTDTNLSSETTYYYRWFTYDWNGNVNDDVSQELSVTTKPPYIVYGFRVDETISDSYQAVTSIEDCADFTPATNSGTTFNSGSWLDKFPFNSIKPCELLGNGTVLKYIDPNNFTKYEDGSSAIGCTRLMIEIPPIYWKFTTTTNGYEVRFSNGQVDSTYKALAHSRGSELKGNLYVGAYEGGKTLNELQSVSGVPPKTSLTINDFRSYSALIGAGYGLMNFHTLTLLQILFIAMFKTINSQAIFIGNTRGSAVQNTGLLDTKGMYYGSNIDNATCMKFMGIENLWGNVFKFIDGIVATTSKIAKISDNTVFNNNGENYPYEISFINSSGNFMSKAVASTIGGFYPNGTSGSSTTYYCDQINVFNPSYPIITNGGNYDDGNGAGIFRLYYMGVTETKSITGARLQYLAP